MTRAELRAHRIRLFRDGLERGYRSQALSGTYWWNRGYEARCQLQAEGVIPDPARPTS